MDKMKINSFERPDIPKTIHKALLLKRQAPGYNRSNYHCMC